MKRVVDKGGGRLERTREEQRLWQGNYLELINADTDRDELVA